MLSNENILENPKLLDMMDDNLSISFSELFFYYKLDKNLELNEENFIQVKF